MSKLSREELIRELENWLREEENMKLGLLRALAVKGKSREKYDEIANEIERREQAYQQIKSMLTPVPEDKLKEFVEKWAIALDNEMHWEDVLRQMLREYEALKGGE